MRVRDLNLLRSESFDVVVNLLYVRRVKRKLRTLLEQERRRFLHVFLGERNRHCGELHLGIPILQFALHFLDLFANATEFLLHLEQIGNLAGLGFQHVDQTLLHHACVLEPRIGIEVRLRHVFGAECLVLQLAKPANFLQKVI